MADQANKTKSEIEQTRDDLGRKVDALVSTAKVEAGDLARKVAVGAGALAGLLIVGMIAKRRIRD
jgi:hypothetical protein